MLKRAGMRNTVAILTMGNPLQTGFIETWCASSNLLRFLLFSKILWLLKVNYQRGRDEGPSRSAVRQPTSQTASAEPPRTSHNDSWNVDDIVVNHDQNYWIPQIIKLQFPLQVRNFTFLLFPELESNFSVCFCAHSSQSQRDSLTRRHERVLPFKERMMTPEPHKNLRTYIETCNAYGAKHLKNNIFFQESRVEIIFRLWGSSLRLRAHGKILTRHWHRPGRCESESVTKSRVKDIPYDGCGIFLIESSAEQIRVPKHLDEPANSDQRVWLKQSSVSTAWALALSASASPCFSGG